MPVPTTTSGVARFGPYELELRSGELRKFGTRIKLGEQPLRILMLLLERQGELVTREELRSTLWTDDTFVDFDHSLNSAVQRLRETLSDTAERAQWIETVPRRGYRFASTVEWNGTNGKAPSVEPPEQRDQEAPVPIFPQSREARTRPLVWRLLLLGTLGLLLAWVWLKWAPGSPSLERVASIHSIAVLPLENLSGDPSQEYFADGMTDEVITALAKSSPLRVISRTSVMQYKGVHRPVNEIARELGVDGILEGSIRRSGNRMHMTVQLIDANSDTHLWAESYDRDVKEAVALPAQLAQSIGKRLQVATAAQPTQRYVNPEAHDAYLRGRFFWFGEDDAASLPYFEKAIQLQPDYAAAWSGLSDYYGARSVEGAIPPDEFRENWEADARKAAALDDSLADAHNSLAGWYLFGAWDCKRAEAESLRAIAANPNYAEAYHVYSYILTITNRPTEAIEAQKRGMEVDPRARPWALGHAYFHIRQFDAAVKELRLREQVNPRDRSTHEILAQSYAFLGMEEAAVQEWEQMYRVQDDKEPADTIRKVFDRGGYKAVPEWMLTQIKAQTRGHYFSPYWMALATAQARHKEETLRLLEDAYREHAPRLVFLQIEPGFDFLHGEPRFQAIARKMGLPPTP